jgi:hypothetical protein
MMRPHAFNLSAHNQPGASECPAVVRLSSFPAFGRTVFTKDLAGEWVHMVNLPTHDADNGLIGLRVHRNFICYKTLNAELRVWAAVNKAGHRGNKRLSGRWSFDMGQLTSCMSINKARASIFAARAEVTRSLLALQATFEIHRVVPKS